MRINVYAEEMTTETELVVKTVKDEEFGERKFYGIRLFFLSPNELHHGEIDDDRSAITFWVKWTKAKGSDFTTVLDAFSHCLIEVDKAYQQEAKQTLQRAAKP